MCFPRIFSIIAAEQATAAIFSTTLLLYCLQLLTPIIHTAPNEQPISFLVAVLLRCCCCAILKVIDEYQSEFEFVSQHREEIPPET